MADTIIRVYDNETSVIVSGSALLTPYVTAAAASAAAADADRIDAEAAAVAAEADAAEAEALVAAAIAEVENTYRTKEDLIADFDNIADDTRITVLVDESKGDAMSIYYKSFGALEYIGSLATTDESTVATGIFFDTDNGNLFTELSDPGDASVTISAGSIAFSSASAVTFDSLVKDSLGNAMKFCFDYMTVDMEVEVTSYPANGSEGVGAAMVNETLGLYGAYVSCHGGTTAQMLPKLMGVGATRDTAGSGQVISSPHTVRMRYIREGATAKAIYNYEGGADQTDLSYTMGYTANSDELPRMFSTAGLRFRQGVITVTKLKVSASYPNARFGFLTDSLGQGRIATAYADGYAAKVRADHPTDVLIAAAPSARTADWLTRMEAFIEMRPHYAFLELGINDHVTGVSLGTFQTNFSDIITALVSEDIIPVVLSLPPRGSGTVPTWNAWLAGLGLHYIDIYTPLLGTGSSLNAAYDSGDGLHWNTAGHDVVYDEVTAYIAANL